MFIGVIGGGNVSSEIADIAEEVGREIALHGAILICGGLGGVMEFACKGAKAEKGMTVGILPGTKALDANKYVDIPVVTGLGTARNSIVVRSSQAVIAVDGEFGTLSEIAYALQYNIPVIGLNTWVLYKDTGKDTSIIVANNPAEAVQKAITEIIRREII